MRASTYAGEKFSGECAGEKFSGEQNPVRTGKKRAVSGSINGARIAIWSWNSDADACAAWRRSIILGAAFWRHVHRGRPPKNVQVASTWAKGGFMHSAFTQPSHPTTFAAHLIVLHH
ncbi:hypothetical protein PPTG_22881 [Phytophthora nicotianae INRA-310]|uniref:Uncharacterized protein n=1 Tax=Phytophthora nicotianae (strain INRA-310) TaxID=761204 RepID=W2Q8G7_PHYN3|nr:hypothetical protein PPTG_22881 [Phytophthora nicotianae INRA-310]ETN09463.1 hypothetical protein PPTG_22881 [Phytophthora nicotianae INRA-310]